MARNWFETLQNPLSEDEDDEGGTSSVPLTSASQMQMPPILIHFFNTLKSYAYNFLDRIFTHAESFCERQEMMGLPRSAQKSLGVIYRMSLDYYKNCPPDEFEREEQIIVRDFNDLRNHWQGAFNLFLLEYYQRD
jgi:hypothetical protein